MEKDKEKNRYELTLSNTGKTRRVTVEVGGGSKGRKKSDFVIRDDSDYPAAGAVPLWLVGMMY